MSDLICIGAIAGSFGVSGEVRLKSFCSEPTDIAAYGPLSTEDGSRTFHVTLTRPVAGGLGARITGVATKVQNGRTLPRLTGTGNGASGRRPRVTEQRDCSCTEEWKEDDDREQREVHAARPLSRGSRARGARRPPRRASDSHARFRSEAYASGHLRP